MVPEGDEQQSMSPNKARRDVSQAFKSRHGPYQAQVDGLKPLLI